MQLGTFGFATECKKASMRYVASWQASACALRELQLKNFPQMEKNVTYTASAH